MCHLHSRNEQNASDRPAARYSNVVEVIDAEDVQLRAWKQADIDLPGPEAVGKHGGHIDTEIKDISLRPMSQSAYERDCIQVADSADANARAAGVRKIAGRQRSLYHS